MSSSSTRARRGGSGGGRQLQFPVGRWRHVAVVDAGCGCRPRRATTRLLSQLPSFLRPSPKPPQPMRSSSRSSSGFFPSSASTASSSAATFTTTHSSYSNYSTYSSSACKKQQDEPQAMTSNTGAAAAARKRKCKKKKKRYDNMGAAAADAEEEDVGVAVEKESSDPRADFRESMVQMVVEMGLCGWDDLRWMLRRLLDLNAPRHHAAILAAFAEVCAQLTAPPYHGYEYHNHY
ncbi:transcription repressor OFP8-like [Phragmites australis]|uniref:transcription repressor OFP8-like n=1 Tax=Phragmites australis TaxID=29695 RepID=UPI002D790914|nr:transcription repressor OFP8-like [Phragmites australis]